MGAISREKALGVFGGLEAPHLLFTQSRGLVRIFRTIVQPFVLTVLPALQDFAFRRAITLQLISDDHARNVLQSFEKLAEKSLGSMLVASALHKDIQHISVLIHCSPQLVSFATDREKHLIQMPLVATTRVTTSQFIGIGLPKLQTPLPNRFIAHDDPALRQKLFHITETERETEIEPHSVAHDFRREAESFVVGGVVFVFVQLF
jgi:hypothetical protein